jgi:hypothetical protein
MVWSPLRTLGLAVLAPLVCFIVSSVYVNLWFRRMDAATTSIAGNGGPSVVYLSMVREDIRRIEHRVLFAAPPLRDLDRAAIAAGRADFDRAVIEYRRTPDYPGETAAWERMRVRSELFFAAVDRALGPTSEGGAARRLPRRWSPPR